VEVNGGPGALVLAPDRRILGVVALEVAGDRIRGVTSIVNPEKLRHLGPVGDLRALGRAGRAGGP
jgi:RNA polymerase sigma-70 factor (ECF subfamily)